MFFQCSNIKSKTFTIAQFNVPNAYSSRLHLLTLVPDILIIVPCGHTKVYSSFRYFVLLFAHVKFSSPMFLHALCPRPSRSITEPCFTFFISISIYRNYSICSQCSINQYVRSELIGTRFILLTVVSNIQENIWQRCSNLANQMHASCTWGEFSAFLPSLPSPHLFQSLRIHKVNLLFLPHLSIYTHIDRCGKYKIYLTIYLQTYILQSYISLYLPTYLYIYL